MPIKGTNTVNNILGQSNLSKFIKIFVKDTSGNPLDGTNISVNGTSKTTDSEGKAGFKLSSDNNYSYTITKTNYDDQVGIFNYPIYKLVVKLYEIVSNTVQYSSEEIQYNSETINFRQWQ